MRTDIKHILNRSNKNSGFTIVELLIGIVIIGILATITIVAYGGVQSRTRDSIRKEDLQKLKTGTQPLLR